MPRYNLRKYYSGYATVTVEAANTEEAWEKVDDYWPTEDNGGLAEIAETLDNMDYANDEDLDELDDDDNDDPIVDTASSVNDYSHHNEEASIIQRMEDADYPPY